MDIVVTFLLVFLVGVIAAFLGAMVGGGGLISIPFLIFLGLPPHMAVATNKFGAVGFSIGAVSKFWKEKKIVWKLVLPFSLIGVVGAYIGANLLLGVNQDTLILIVGLILLSFLPILFLKKNLGVIKNNPTQIKKLLGYFALFLVMVYGGFFSGGAGILIFYTLMFFFGLTIIESNATNMIPWLLQSIVALIVFILNDLVVFSYGLALFFGMILGGYLGAHVAIKKGNKWLKSLFVLIVIASVIKLLFF